MTQQSADNAYYVPQPSRWPITGACALLIALLGAATWINRGAAGPYILAAGVALLVYMLFGWFGTVIRESEAGLYNKQVDRSYRWAMGWFIFSETIFFAAFFGALFYIRWHAVPDLASGRYRRTMARLQGQLAHDGARYRGAVDADARHGHSTHQYSDPASPPPRR
jgi:cytochrome c oxidase subunit 3